MIYFGGDELEVGGVVAAGLSGNTCTNTIHFSGSDGTNGGGALADTPMRCGPVKKDRFLGDVKVMPFTNPFAFGGAGIVKRKTSLAGSETSSTSNCWMHFVVTLGEQAGKFEKS